MGDARQEAQSMAEAGGRAAGEERPGEVGFCAGEPLRSAADGTVPGGAGRLSWALSLSVTPLTDLQILTLWPGMDIRFL